MIGTGSFVTVAAGVGSAHLRTLAAQWPGGFQAGRVFARVRRSANGGSTWNTISEGTAAHPGGTPDQTIDVTEATLADSPGHQFRVT